ncbi:MAG: hypothetical protein ACYC0V_20415 [Armatimonadota bacterium]
MKTKICECKMLYKTYRIDETHAILNAVIMKLFDGIGLSAQTDAIIC